jgi:hypothetical protein
VLVEEATDLSDESVVGDEAHIIGEKLLAARGHLGVGRDDLDDYDNLLLLCKVHHKLVDDQPETYPVERLRKMKADHERWLRDTLASRPGGMRPHFALLHRMRSGKELCNIIGGAYVFLLDHDEPDTEEEATLISGFMQYLQDLGDCWSDMEGGQYVEMRFSLTKNIHQVEAGGFLVFGTKEQRKMRFGDNVSDCPVAIVTVVRATNNGITEVGDFAALIAK